MKSIIVLLIAAVCLVLNPVNTYSQQSIEKVKSEDAVNQDKSNVKNAQKQQDANIKKDKQRKKKKKNS